MAASTTAPTGTIVANYGSLFNAARDTYAATTEIFSDDIDCAPGASAITIWAFSTRAGTLAIYYVPLGGSAGIKLDGTTSDSDTNYNTTLAASVLTKITIKDGLKRIRLGFTPAAATAGSIYANAFAQGVKP